MELTIKSKFASEEILEKRRQMIKNEKLHIKDEISMETLKNLYREYGQGFDEIDFAWAFLDIDQLRYTNIKSGKTEKTAILVYEYVSNEEFENIRNEVTKEYNLKHGEKRSSEEILEMYDKFSGRLSIGLFLEEILGIRSSIIKNFKKGDVKNGKINFDSKPGEYNTFYKKKPDIPMYVLNPDYIYELRKKLFSEANLCVGDSISYEQLQALDKEYCLDLPEIIFAQKVIGMQTNSFNALKNHKSKNPINELVFQDVDIPNEYIREITDKIAILHKLEAGQLLERERFYDFYDRYGGILSRQKFATLVLEISNKSYSDMINESSKSITILSSREETDFDTLSKKIVKAEKLHHGDWIKYEQFKEIHQKYTPNVSEFVFAEKVLGIKSHCLENMKYNGSRSRIYLKLPSKNKLKKLQKKVIIENNIHINDELDYKEVERLYEIYGGILPIKMFAIEILGIDKQSFLRIKNHDDKKALALFNLKISKIEIEEVKQKVILKANLQKPRELTLEEINDLYAIYGGIMSKVMFARKILGVSNDSLNDLKYKKYDKTMVCVRLDFNDEEVEKIKEYMKQGLSDTKIAIRMGVTVTFLRISMNTLHQKSFLYEKVKELKDQGNVPEQMLEKLKINEEDLKEMLVIYRKERLENSKKARKANIEEKARKVIDDYNFTDKNIKIVRVYIEECKKSFEEGEFLKKDLDFLMECMIFVQCNCKEIEFFSKICISYNEYQMASRFIAENIDNEDILPEEKVKLRSFRQSIEHTIKKENALKILRYSNKAAKQISEETGLLEVEVIELKRRIDAEKIAIIGDGSTQGEEDGQIH